MVVTETRLPPISVTRDPYSPVVATTRSAAEAGNAAARRVAAQTIGMSFMGWPFLEFVGGVRPEQELELQPQRVLVLLQCVATVEVVLQAKLRVLGGKPGEGRGEAPASAQGGIARFAGITTHPVDPQPDDLARAISPIRLEVTTPVAEARRREVLRGPHGGAAAHHLGLHLDEGESLERVDRLPLPEAVETVDAGAGGAAGTVGTESGRGAQQDGLGVAEVEGGRVPRHDEQVGEARHRALTGLATEERLAGRAAEARDRFSLAVLNGQEGFGVEVARQQPGEPQAGRAQAVRAEEAPVHQRLIDEIPRVRVGRVEPAELGEELPRLRLEPMGQRRRRDIHLFELDLGLAFGRDLEDEVGLTAEVGVYRALEDGLDVLHREPPLG